MKDPATIPIGVICLIGCLATGCPVTRVHVATEDAAVDGAPSPEAGADCCMEDTGLQAGAGAGGAGTGATGGAGMGGDAGAGNGGVAAAGQGGFAADAGSGAAGGTAASDAGPDPGGAAADAAYPADAAGAGAAADAADEPVEPQCSENDHCEDPAASRCDTDNGICTSCQSSEDCSHITANPGCYDGACVPCTVQAHCPSAACDTTTHSCVECVLLGSLSLGCESASPVCNPAPSPADNRCVQCTDSNHCSGTEPICGNDNTCRACRQHAECDFQSGVCNWQTGTCLPEDQIIYVDDCTGTGSGTAANPFCAPQDAVDAVEPGRTTILVSGPGPHDPFSIDDKGSVWIVGQKGAVVQGQLENSPVVVVSGNTQLTIEGIRIVEGIGSDGDGIRCVSTSSDPTLTIRQSEITGNGGAGILATSCTVILDANTISNNAGGGVDATDSNVILDANTISNNAGGGVSLDGCAFAVANNVIAENGTDSSSFGGIYVDTPGNPARIVHNTVARNNSNGATSGILCTVGDCAGVLVNSNISYGNYDGDISGNLAPVHCLIGDGIYTGGSDNRSGDPSFVDIDNKNYHIQPTSQCIDEADGEVEDPQGRLEHDIDGHTRPQGDGPDIGADEAG